MLPEWMVPEPNRTTSCSAGGRRGRRSFLSKSIQDMKKALCEELVTGHWAKQAGLWQRLDPGVKLVSAVLLILLAGMTKSLGVLLFLWGLIVGLMLLSRLPVLTIQKRVWGFIPLLTLLAAVPGMFNIVVDGSPLVMLYETSHPVTWFGLSGPGSIYITVQGLWAAMFLVLRVGISLSVGILLTATTPLAALLSSLRVLRVPTLFVMVIEMSYRYLVLLLTISIEMFDARTLRTVGDLPLRKKQELVGSSIGALFIRSLTLSEEVYMAMSARCYTGEVAAREKYRIGRLDIAWISIIALISIAVTTGGFVFV